MDQSVFAPETPPPEGGPSGHPTRNPLQKGYLKDTFLVTMHQKEHFLVDALQGGFWLDDQKDYLLVGGFLVPETELHAP